MRVVSAEIVKRPALFTSRITAPVIWVHIVVLNDTIRESYYVPIQEGEGHGSAPEGYQVLSVEGKDSGLSVRNDGILILVAEALVAATLW